MGGNSLGVRGRGGGGGCEGDGVYMGIELELTEAFG